MTRKQKGKSLILAAAVLMTSMTTMSSFGTAKVSAAASPSFDENNIVLSFAQVSDVHVGTSTGGNADKLAAAIKYLKTESGNSLDAFCIAGDLTNAGTAEQLSGLKYVLDNNLDTGTEVVFCGGNHDIDATLGKKNIFKDVLGSWVYRHPYSTDLSSDVIAGNYHTVINGYHFIAITMKSSAGDMIPSDITWLRAQMEAAKKDAPDKPIFVQTHPPAYDMQYGSHLDDTYSDGPGKAWNDTKIAGVLNDYPQAVLFSGHTHFPLNPETSIMQKGFTSVGTASVAYMSLDPFYIDTPGNTEPSDAGLVSEGMLVQVDKNNVIRIKRLDFTNSSEIKQPWVFATATDTSKFVYTPDRGKNKAAPQFPAGSALNVRFNGTEAALQVTLTFNNANDSDMVHKYKVEIYSKDGSKLYYSNYAFSDFYLHPDEKLADTIKKQFKVGKDLWACNDNLPSQGDVLVKVTPLDSWDNAGTALTAVVTTPVHNVPSSSSSTPSSSSSAASSSSPVSSSVSSSSAVSSSAVSSSDASSSTPSTETPSSEQASSAASSAASNNSNPKTGDYMAASIFSLIAAGLGIILLRKRKNS